MQLKRYMGLYDIHIGRQNIIRGYKMVSENTHDVQAIKATMEFAADFKPDYVILGGDQLNCGPVSHWNTGKPRLQPDLPLKWEMDELNALVLRGCDAIVPRNGRKVWKRGNHENWITQFIDVNPGVSGLIEPENYLRLENRGWEIAGDEDIVKFGKINFIHGHEVFKRGSVIAGSGAKKLGNAYGRNVRAGHLHTYEVYTHVTPLDRTDYHSSIIVPSLARVGQAYSGGSPSNYQQGFIYGYIMPDGNFNDYVVIINDGKFAVNGRVYGGR